jgi:hypothetical protein
MNRVWAFIISKKLSNSQLDTLAEQGNNFVKSWTAHDQQLTANFRIFNDRIILVNVNESVTNASGCSIDKLTRFIKETELSLGVELLNRLLVAYQSGEHTEVVHASQIKELLSKGILSANTLVYNTAVANENELKNWEQPLQNTWLKKYLSEQL